MASQPLHIELDKSKRRILVRGPLDIYHYKQAEADLSKATASADYVDLSQVTHLDTAGAFLLHTFKKHPLAIEGFTPQHQMLFDLVAQSDIKPPPKRKPPSALTKTVLKVGRASIAAGRASYEFIHFTGMACLALVKAARRPSRLRITPIIHHMEAIGIDAIPIIALIAFVISIVIAYQGQVQLRPLGAERYTINLVAISVLREMGVLLTAIMIAGRSGSAFTAEIGVMEVREEVDALRTLGFDPFELLVLPRLIALMLVLPLLAFIADIMGLFGGGIMSLSLLGIPLPQYFEQARQAATWKDFFVGMVKAPIFAFIIALVGCLHGLKVSGSSESVGRETTASVVEAIFLVLMLDGLFSIYFDKVGL